MCAHVRGRPSAYVLRHTFPLSSRKIESTGRVSMARLKSSGTISIHSSPLHLPQVALSSSQSTVCLLSYPINMNMDVSVESSGLTGKTTECSINEYRDSSFSSMHMHDLFC